ncbi:MAG: DUF2264 domain-containing protein [Verrucomicrobia bacterium]|nr:DUF2264 domain-containing protein [Verrucomicrobiota bacterium]
MEDVPRKSPGAPDAICRHRGASHHARRHVSGHWTLDRVTFDAAGWLRIGVSGSQPGLGETYISTGSLYLCSAAFLPLGLPASDPFWSAPAAKTTWQKIWSGENLPADHAIKSPK